jgi:hypothetical protein
MRDELFADGIGEITVTGTTVRIDLVSLSPTERDGEGKPVPQLRQRIVMPVDGFANAYELMRRALDGLVEAGAIVRAPVAMNGKAPVAIMPTARTARGNSSPNFS